MTLKLTVSALHAMMPNAPMAYLQAMVDGQAVLAGSGALETINRCVYLFANAAEESGEFGPREITENIHYTAARACAVWSSRFHSVGDVYAKIGSFAGDPNFSTKLMDNVYGNRMGDRPGTHDGSEYIGRGGLQLTGRDEYDQMAKATGLDLVIHPELATLPANQDPIMAAYVKIRGLNAFADQGDFTGYVRRINGGTIGMPTRSYYLHHMMPVVTALTTGVFRDDGHSIADLQKFLNQDDNAGLTVDGQVGPATSAAVKVFQERNGLQPDGIAGPATWAAIDKMKAATS